MTFVVAACQVAARADALQPSSSLGEEVLDERAVLDQPQAQDRVADLQRR
jgi:hypothetical protein